MRHRVHILCLLSLSPLLVSTFVGIAIADGELVPIYDASIPNAVGLKVGGVSNSEAAVAVGDWVRPDGHLSGYRFQAGTITDLGPGLPPGSLCRGNAVSQDGDVVVGVGCGSTGAFRWIEGVVQDLGNLGGVGTGYPTEASDVSADGSVIVGWSPSLLAPTYEAFRWTDDGMVGLGDLPLNEFQSQANAVSSDGLVVVGEGRNHFPDAAFRWASGIMESLGDLPGGDPWSRANGVSADGSVVVGSSISQGFLSPGEPFIWTAEAGMIGLGLLPGGNPSGNGGAAHDVSGDGRIVVGRSPNLTGNEAFVWDEAFGMRPLKEVLTNEFNIDTSLFSRLDTADAISDDGRVIGGDGPAVGLGFDIGWMAVLPHPPGQFGCNVEMSDAAYGTGDAVQIATLRFANFGSAPLPARLRLQLTVPALGTIQLLDLGADGSIAMPSGLNVDLGPVLMFEVQPGQPRGGYALRCALEVPGTGRVQAEDRALFDFE